MIALKPWRAARLALAAPLLLAVLGLECEKLDTPNDPPSTFFAPDGAPPETLITLDFTFHFFGSDPDSDRRGYEWRMLRMVPCDPVAIEEADSVPWNFVELDGNRVPYSFADPVTHPDGPYVFQAQTIDERGLRDAVPLTDCFYVQVQLAPIVEITSKPPDRAGGIPAYTYAFVANKYDRAGDLVTVPSGAMEYRWTFQRTFPNPLMLYPLGEWLPTNQAQVEALQPGSQYLFRVQARDSRYEFIESVYEVDTFTN